MLIYMHLQYLCFLFDCPVDVDVCIYSTYVFFLIVLLMLMYCIYGTCAFLIVDVDVCKYSTCAFLIVNVMFMLIMDNITRS